MNEFGYYPHCPKKKAKLGLVHQVQMSRLFQAREWVCKWFAEIKWGWGIALFMNHRAPLSPHTNKIPKPTHERAQGASRHTLFPSVVRAFSNRIANTPTSLVPHPPPHSHTHTHTVTRPLASELRLANAYVSLSHCLLNHWIPLYPHSFLKERSSRVALIQSVPSREKQDVRRWREGGMKEEEGWGQRRREGGKLRINGEKNV